MYRTYVYWLLPLLLLALAGNGQTINRRGLKADTGKFYIRCSPLGIIDLYDGNLTLGGEYRLNNTWAATLDAGAILYSTYFEAKQSRGFLFRPGIRFYPKGYKDFFIDLQLHYKNVTYRIKDWLQKDVVDNVPSYEEYKTFRFKKQVMGVHVMAGFRNYFDYNHRFYLEGYVGLGLHYKDEGLYNEPNSEYGFGLRVRKNTGKYVVPALPAGMRFVYLLR
jgi:hypothetical protein